MCSVTWARWKKGLWGGLWSRCMNLNKAPAVSNCRNEMHFFPFGWLDWEAFDLSSRGAERWLACPAYLLSALPCWVLASYLLQMVALVWDGRKSGSYLFIYFSIKCGTSEQRFKGSKGSDALTVLGPRRRSNIALLSTVSLGIQRQTAGAGSRYLTLQWRQVFTNDSKTVKRPIYMHMKVTKKKCLCRVPQPRGAVVVQ